MTVRELVALLLAHPHQDDLVVLAGCDCENAMGPAEGWKHLEREKVEPGINWPLVNRLVLQIGPDWENGGRVEEERVAAIQAAGRVS